MWIQVGSTIRVRLVVIESIRLAKMLPNLVRLALEEFRGERDIGY